MPVVKNKKKSFKKISLPSEEEKHEPASIEGERFLLGALLTGERTVYDEVMEILKPEDFLKPQHQDIFSCIEGFYKQGRTGDILSVSEGLKKEDKLEGAGGGLYLAELVEESASPIGAEECAKIIREKSILRQIIKVCLYFRQKALAHDFPNLDSFIDSFEKALFEFSGNRGQNQLWPLTELVKPGMDRLEELHHKKLSITGVASSFTELDHLTSGFQPGELTVIAARPSMGKTAFSLNIALSAGEAGKKVAFFSVEMAKEQILMRLLSLKGQAPLSHLRTGQIASKDWDRLVSAAAHLSEMAIFVDDSSFLSPFEVRSRARRLKSQKGLDLLIIDYLQLMGLKDPMESREREVSEISRLLKSIAKELKIPVIALSQLNRGVESRTNRRPLLSDLRESGSIEQDADVIIMLYRDDYYNTDSEKKGQAELILNKQRNGPTGKVYLKWNPLYGMFENDIPGDSPPQSSISHSEIEGTPF